jgi:hypothetical protein
MTPSLTFIIPAHNAAATIGATLRSITAQTRRDWLAIVIDDGSTDGTRRAAESTGNPRIKVLAQPNAGVATARNRGLSLAQTPAVCFIDADDTIEPTFLETMLPRLEGHDLAAAGYRYADPDLADVGWTVQPGPEDHCPGRLAEFNQFAIGAIVFNRESLLRLSDPAPFPSGTTQEDWSLLLKLSLAGARWAPHTNEPLFNYRLRPQSRTTALCEIWRDGLNLIAAHHPDATTRELALRRWTVRNLARAAAAGDRRLCDLFFEHLDTLTAFDADTLAGGLRWSLRRMTVAREPQSLLNPAAWNMQILSALGQDELARESLRRATHPDWDQVAAAAAARLRPDQTLVIYGLGRNGRELLTALKPRRVALAVIDDGSTSTDLPRLTIPDLSPEHVVLVTPDDRSAILSGLRRGKQAQVLLPEQLVA